MSNQPVEEEIITRVFNEGFIMGELGKGNEDKSIAVATQQLTQLLNKKIEDNNQKWVGEIEKYTSDLYDVGLDGIEMTKEEWKSLKSKMGVEDENT